MQILVLPIEVNKDTLACGVQPLDLITHWDSMPVESLGDSFGRCNLFSTMTQTVAAMWIVTYRISMIARTSLVPSMSDLHCSEF